MIRRDTLVSILFGGFVLLLASSDVSVAQNRFPQITVVPGEGVKGLAFDFIITDSKNAVLCEGKGMKLSIRTPAVSCPNLVPLKTPVKLKISMGPEASIKCAPKKKPIEFTYAYPQDIIIVTKNIKKCEVEAS